MLKIMRPRDACRRDVLFSASPLFIFISAPHSWGTPSWCQWTDWRTIDDFDCFL